MFYLNIACRYPWAVQYFVLPIFCRREKRWGTKTEKPQTPISQPPSIPSTIYTTNLAAGGCGETLSRARPVIIGLVPRMSAAFLRCKLSQSLAELETTTEGRRSRAALKEKRMEINLLGSEDVLSIRRGNSALLRLFLTRYSRGQNAYCF